MVLPYLPFTDEELFQTLNLALPAWLLLAILPRWKYTQFIAGAIALFFAAMYFGLFVDTMFFHPLPGVGFESFASLDGIVKMFSHKSAVFGGWVHYVVFDLWTGM
jgi:Domain of unknown function (DUF4281)